MAKKFKGEALMSRIKRKGVRRMITPPRMPVEVPHKGSATLLRDDWKSGDPVHDMFVLKGPEVVYTREGS